MSKYYLNFIRKWTRSGRELFDHPSYTICCYCIYLCCVNVI